MLYALIITIFLGIPGNSKQLEVAILTENLQQCEKLASEVYQKAEIPVLKALSRCEPIKTT